MNDGSRSQMRSEATRHHIRHVRSRFTSTPQMLTGSAPSIIERSSPQAVLCLSALSSPDVYHTKLFRRVCSELQNDRRVPKRRGGAARGRSDASDVVDREVDGAKNPNYLVCIRKVFPIRSVKSGTVRKRSTRRVWRYRFRVASRGIWLDTGRSLRDRYALRPSRQNLGIRSVNGVRIES